MTSKILTMLMLTLGVCACGEDATDYAAHSDDMHVPASENSADSIPATAQATRAWEPETGQCPALHFEGNQAWCPRSCYIYGTDVPTQIVMQGPTNLNALSAQALCDLVISCRQC